MNRVLNTSRGAIDIRKAHAGDVFQYRELRLEALRDSPTAFGADLQRTLDQPAQYWEDLLAADANESTIFLADHKSILIGATGIARGGSPKTRHSATIWGVYVTPEWRGLHIAEALIDAGIQWAIARGIVVAKLSVAATNRSAIRCYERCGFWPYGTEPRAGYYEGKYYDGLLMFRSLES